MYTCVPLRTFHQAEQLRVLRNACACWMTGSRQQISVWRQAAWFYLEYKRHTDRYSVMLYYQGAELAGYGALLRIGLWFGITEAVAEAERGKGLGTRILDDMLNQTGSSPVFVSIFSSNTTSIRLHRRSGFVLAGTSGTGVEPISTFVKLRE